MDHVPSSTWNILLKIKPSFNAYSIRFFFFFTLLYLFLLMWLLCYPICLFIFAWKQIGSGMSGSVNEQDACTCEHDFFWGTAGTLRPPVMSGFSAPAWCIFGQRWPQRCGVEAVPLLDTAYAHHLAMWLHNRALSRRPFVHVYWFSAMLFCFEAYFW